MNEFNSNPQKTPTEIGTPKPFNSPETIIHNPELLGNDQVEVGHELGLEVDTMIKEAQNLAETTTEATVEIPQVDLVADLTAVTENLPVAEELIAKKDVAKKGLNFKALGLLATTTFLGGAAAILGLGGKPKMPEVPMTDSTPKVGQTNTTTNSPTINYFEHSSNSGAGIVQADKPTSRMSGATMPDVPSIRQAPTPSEYEPTQGEIQTLLDEEVPRDEAIKRLKAEHTRIEGAKANNAKVFGQPKGWDQAAENKAQDEARAMEKVNQINDIGNQPADYSKLTGNTEQTFGGFKVNDQARHSKEEMKEYMIKNAREMGSSEADIAKAIKDFDTAYSNSGLK
jgi:hypothetical protein